MKNNKNIDKKNISQVNKRFSEPTKLSDPVTYTYAESILRNLNLQSNYLTKELFHQDILNMFAEGTIFFSNSDSQPFHSKSLENYFNQRKAIEANKENSNWNYEYLLNKDWRQLPLNKGYTLVSTAAYDEELFDSGDEVLGDQNYDDQNFEATINKRIVPGNLKLHSHATFFSKNFVSKFKFRNIPVLSKRTKNVQAVLLDSQKIVKEEKKAPNLVSGYYTNMWIKTANSQVQNQSNFKDAIYLDSLRYDNNFSIKFNLNKLISQLGLNYQNGLADLKFVVFLYERFKNCTTKKSKESIYGTGFYKIGDNKISFNAWKEDVDSNKENRNGEGIIFELDINSTSDAETGEVTISSNLNNNKSLFLNFASNNEEYQNQDSENKINNFFKFINHTEALSYSIHFLVLPTEEPNKDLDLLAKEVDITYLLNSKTENTNHFLNSLANKNLFSWPSNGVLNKKSTYDNINSDFVFLNEEQKLVLSCNNQNEINLNLNNLELNTRANDNSNYYDSNKFDIKMIQAKEIYKTQAFRVAYLPSQLNNYDVLFVTVVMKNDPNIKGTFPIFKLVNKDTNMWKGIGNNFSDGDSVWKGSGFLSWNNLTSNPDFAELNWFKAGISVNLNNWTVSLTIDEFGFKSNQITKVNQTIIKNKLQKNNNNLIFEQKNNSFFINSIKAIKLRSYHD